MFFKDTALIKFNIKHYLDRELVNNGLYFNVSSGAVGLDGTRIDTLSRLDGNVYESYFNNWIYETDASGIAPYNTVHSSGVTIDGVFHLRNTSPHFPQIDFVNGRVYFNGTDPGTTATVRSVFSYKDVSVDFPNSEAVNFVFSKFKDNTDFTNNSLPSGIQRQLPLIVIDPQRNKFQPKAIGGNFTVNQLIVFHILATNDNTMDTIIDLLGSENFKNTIQGVDFNKTDEILNDFGDYASSYANFTSLQGQNLKKWFKIYIDDVEMVERKQVRGIEIARIHWNVTIYKQRFP